MPVVRRWRRKSSGFTVTSRGDRPLSTRASETFLERSLQSSRSRSQKNLEERYQTVTRLEAHLRQCLADCKAQGHIEPFVLGARDASERMVIPERFAKYCFVCADFAKINLTSSRYFEPPYQASARNAFNRAWLPKHAAARLLGTSPNAKVTI
jgi:hypothetical protein